MIREILDIFYCFFKFAKEFIRMVFILFKKNYIF